jgi:hypothetical protein
VKAKLKINDDEESGGAGAGTGVPQHVAPAEPAPLAIDEARAIVAIARNGGAVANVVLPDIVTAATASKLRASGLIETLPNIGAERARVRLSCIGIQRLVDAQKLVAATPGFAR